MKRVLSIQDISCVGKCSLTVALPIISAAGIETSILPTAVLSTHTLFKNFTFRDLTDDIPAITEHWLAEKITFDGIATGYLGSFRQIELVEKIFENFTRDGVLRFVDPAMGDNGKLYVGFDEAFARRMGQLCGKADIIVPNLTEAAFMLGEKFMESGYSAGDIRSLLKRLCELGCPVAVLTGVSPEAGKCGAMAYISERPGAVSACAANDALSFVTPGFEASEEDTSIAVALRQADTELCAQINAALATIDEETRVALMTEAQETQPGE